jgi:fatty acid synthase
MMSSLCLICFQLESPVILRVSSENFDWVEPLKTELATCQSAPETRRVWLLAETYSSGVVGMVNCLRQEPGGDKLR